LAKITVDTNDALDIAAKAEYLKINTELGEIKLEAHNRVNIQPDETPFGIKIEVGR
jgi:hypothetical protein